MKALVKSIPGLRAVKKVYLFAATGIFLLLSSILGMAASQDSGIRISLAKLSHPNSSTTIREQISADKKELFYPASVDRFYKQAGYKLIWIPPDTVKTNASEAMLLLDCVLQYGLNHNDYHPKELNYDRLNALRQHFDKAGNEEKVRFDVMLTDAMLNFINNLHFGKLNPDYPASKIDTVNVNGFAADAILADAVKGKDFMDAILAVQPKLAAYTDLQNHLHLLAGQYVGDCYEIPGSDIRKIGINLERLRWLTGDDKTWVHINVPSFSLKYHQTDTTYQFKVVVGKPAAPTPTLQSAISYFTTAPEWNVPQKIFVKELLPRARKNPNYFEDNNFVIYNDRGNYTEASSANLARVRQNPSKYHARQTSGCDNSLGLIVFRFSNVYDVYLHDTPEQQLFKKEVRDFSHGCVRVEHAENLAELLLKNDRAADKIADLHRAWDKYLNKTFKLKTVVPIKITYLTCEVKEGQLITYNDIYGLDKNLEMALYNIYQPLVVQ